jgi:hypothetical protein
VKLARFVARDRIAITHMVTDGVRHRIDLVPVRPGVPKIIGQSNVRRHVATSFLR